MKTFKVLGDKVLVCLFDTKKEMNFHLFRMSEFQESPHAEIKGQYFYLTTFLENYSDKDGNITYFSFWEGHNLSKNTIIEFYDLNRNNKLTSFEVGCASRVKNEGVEYVIAAVEGDDTTLKHELMHAHYTLDETHRDKMVDIFLSIDPDVSRKIGCDLSILYTSDLDLVMDETQAYFLTSTEDELVETFPSLTIDEILEVQKIYKDVL